MVEPAIFGPIDALLAPVIEYVVLLLVLVNLVTRYLASERHRRQAEDGPEAVTRYVPHELSNVVLILVSFYYITLNHHSGIVLSVLVIGTVLTDFFEFEGRLVEARQDMPIEAPKGAIAGSLIVAAYAAYLALFFVIEPVWNAIV
jgi:ABC-type xylose transport system permease subunit